MSQLLIDLTSAAVFMRGHNIRLSRSHPSRLSRREGHRLIRKIHALYDEFDYPKPTRIKTLNPVNLRPRLVRWSWTYHFLPNETHYWIGQLRGGEPFHFEIPADLADRLEAGIPTG